MLSEALLAFRGFEIGKAFMGLGAAKATASTATAKATPSNTFAGGLSGMVSRHVQQSTASSISGQSGGIGASLGSAMYHNVGATGDVTGNHLHICVIIDGVYVNPKGYLH